MLPLVAIAPAVAGGVGLEFAARALGWLPTIAPEEFPAIDRELPGKFSSVDPEHGWMVQHDQEKRTNTGDHLSSEVGRVVTCSTDEYPSRVGPASDRDEDVTETASIVGDSECFCRTVDDETRAVAR
ncbi:hypothetical protein [Natrinema caseinilyticum]|uniref:hypothetical protein n=1 Tax=Natrinema caseinilyticum TaxID=2961570 RepID=UPI0020C23E30|nr:hypothetical protein [Natrinema caseinilyticum]